jgi:hypothetical protein
MTNPLKEMGGWSAMGWDHCPRGEEGEREDGTNRFFAAEKRSRTRRAPTPTNISSNSLPLQ